MSGPADRISPHFRVIEFACRDGTPCPTYCTGQLELWAQLWGEPLRRRFGAVRVVSGYRTLAHNRAVGGAPGSWHLYSERVASGGGRRGTRGVAADVIPAHGSASEWAMWARGHRANTGALSGDRRGGVGYYPEGGFIHLDTGPLRDWRGP